jgi:hypothetical protein
VAPDLVRSRFRWLAPDFGTFFVLLHVAAAIGRAGYELKDPGVGWHLVAGRLILEQGAIPATDPFSFTAEGRPWLNYYWGFQAVSAWLERTGGLPLVSATWTLVYALVPFTVYRWMVRSGASLLAIFLVLPVVELVLLSHAFARPHVVTYLCFALLVARLDDVRAGRRRAGALWWLPGMAVVWANMHGGFIVGLAVIALAGGGSALARLVRRDADAGRFAVVCAGLLVAMAAATCVNPYGLELHRQAFAHLSLPSTAYFVEFLSPNFRDGHAAVRAFEMLILALVGMTTLGWLQLAWAELAVVVGTLHAGLTAVRNMNLFAIVVAPMLARGLERPLVHWAPGAVARWRTIADEQERRGAWRVQVPLVAAGVLALTLGGRLPWLRTLDGLQLTAGAASFIEERPERFQRIFNTDTLGGSLIYRLWPHIKVFVDDRTPVYGEAFIMNDYFTVLYGRGGWEAVLDRWGITAAIVATGTRPASLLRAMPEWRVDYEDARSVIFTREPRSITSPPLPSPP